jgi:hypothetical protein
LLAGSLLGRTTLLGNAVTRATVAFLLGIGHLALALLASRLGCGAYRGRLACPFFCRAAGFDSDRALLTIAFHLSATNGSLGIIVLSRFVSGSCDSDQQAKTEDRTGEQSCNHRLPSPSVEIDVTLRTPEA